MRRTVKDLANLFLLVVRYKTDMVIANENEKLVVRYKKCVAHVILLLTLRKRYVWLVVLIYIVAFPLRRALLLF